MTSMDNVKTENQTGQPSEESIKKVAGEVIKSMFDKVFKS
jgi:hypothetical protein